MPEIPGTTERIGTPVDGVTVLGALSPSRAGDFKTCPLMYRYRTVDKLPELPSPAAARGTVVHKVLEDLFDVPAAERTPERAAAMIPGAWAHVSSSEGERAALFTPEQAAEEQQWLESCADVLRVYFTLEDPSRIEPAEREVYIESLLESGLLLRGFVDRLDVAPDGAIRVVDYKAAHSPGVGFEAKALFQLRFYALVLWRTRGVVPSVLRLMYLANGEMISYSPDADALRATERQLEALWEAIRYARQSGDWQPSRSSFCSWCSFKAHCPEWGGEVLPLPSPEQERSEVLDAETGEAVAEDPPLPLQDGDVVGHHQHGAAGSDS